MIPLVNFTHAFSLFLFPAASSISSESSPVSSPATNHSSPVSTPKRGPLGQGPVLVAPAGHNVPNTPPVVTIAPTKTSNGLWRSEGRQVTDYIQTPTTLTFSLLLLPFFVFSLTLSEVLHVCGIFFLCSFLKAPKIVFIFELVCQHEHKQAL